METTSKTNLDLLAHLMRRAGFGSTLTELKELAKNHTKIPLMIWYITKKPIGLANIS